MNTYLHVLKNYAVFRGRASRKEYWVFYLYNITLIAIATLLDNIFGIALVCSTDGTYPIVWQPLE